MRPWRGLQTDHSRGRWHCRDRLKPVLHALTRITRRLQRLAVTQKIAARALIANRINTAIGVVVLIVGIIVVVTVGYASEAGGWSIFVPGAIYFGIAAYDDVRVRTRAFAENPKVLFRYDFIDIHHLDPI